MAQLAGNWNSYSSDWPKSFWMKTGSMKLFRSHRWLSKSKITMTLMVWSYSPCSNCWSYHRSCNYQPETLTKSTQYSCCINHSSVLGRCWKNKNMTEQTSVTTQKTMCTRIWVASCIRYFIWTETNFLQMNPLVKSYSWILVESILLFIK